MGDASKQELKSKVLRILSVDARISMQDLANELKTNKVNAYNLFNEAAQEYGVSFVPEIRIDKLWKWEFIKRARLRTKRGILAEAVDELPVTGFGEYIILIKFVGKEPQDDEIIKAVGNSYVPQFVAKVKGEYNLFAYAIARSYEDAIHFTDTLNKNLSKYNMIAFTTRVWGNFGFFPLSKALIGEFDIFDTYKNLLFGLNDSGRNTFTEIGKRFNQGPAQMLYAYDRLSRTEILKRVTYFEAKPSTHYNFIAMVKIENSKLFEESKCNWLMKLVKEYEKNENECVFMCDTPAPKGMFVVASFENKQRADKFFACMKHCAKGIDTSTLQISKVLLGSIGIRNFDMRYASQYKMLERRRLVPALNEKPAEIVVENPDAL